MVLLDVSTSIMYLKNILVPLGLFLTLFGAFYLFLNTRYRERMAMIERGLDPRQSSNGTETSRQRALRYGLLITGGSLGLVLGDLAFRNDILSNEIAYPCLALLGGGLGLLLYYLLTRNQPPPSAPSPKTSRDLATHSASLAD